VAAGLAKREWERGKEREGEREVHDSVYHVIIQKVEIPVM